MDIDIFNIGTRNVKTRTTKSKLKTRADESEFCTLTVDEMQMMREIFQRQITAVCVLDTETIS